MRKGECLLELDKIGWQRKYLKAQESIFSKGAFHCYKKSGRGILYVDISKCTELTVCGLNLPGLEYIFGDRVFKNFGKEGPFIDFFNNYNPETEYLVAFQPLKRNKIRMWKRDLKLLSEEGLIRELGYAQILIDTFVNNPPVVDQKLFQSETRH